VGDAEIPINFFVFVDWPLGSWRMAVDGCPSAPNANNPLIKVEFDTCSHVLFIMPKRIADCDNTLLNGKRVSMYRQLTSTGWRNLFNELEAR
jgi:hypothetical protein